MTRQSLSRFLSDRRELRTFMTLPFDIDQAARATRKEARKLFARGNPVNHAKTQDFRQKTGKIMLKGRMRHFLRLFAAGSLMALAACAGKHPPAPAAAPPPAPVAHGPRPAALLHPLAARKSSRPSSAISRPPRLPTG